MRQSERLHSAIEPDSSVERAHGGNPAQRRVHNILWRHHHAAADHLALSAPRCATLCVWGCSSFSCSAPSERLAGTDRRRRHHHRHGDRHHRRGIGRATVTATNAATNYPPRAPPPRTASTPSLRCLRGPTTVTVDAKGFKTLKQENLDVVGLGVLGFNPSLAIGTATETVDVTAAPPVLDTDSAILGAVMENETYSNLPIVQSTTQQRDPTAFATLSRARRVAPAHRSSAAPPTTTATSIWMACPRRRSTSRATTARSRSTSASKPSTSSRSTPASPGGVHGRRLHELHHEVRRIEVPRPGVGVRPQYASSKRGASPKGTPRSRTRRGQTRTGAEALLSTPDELSASDRRFCSSRGAQGVFLLRL